MTTFHLYMSDYMKKILNFFTILPNNTNFFPINFLLLMKELYIQLCC